MQSLILFLPVLVCIGVEGHGFLSWPTARSNTSAAVHTEPCGVGGPTPPVIFWIGNNANNVTHIIENPHGGGFANFSIIYDGDTETAAEFDKNILILNGVVDNAAETHSYPITFPNKECNNCVMRWVWDAPQEAAVPYVNCADIAILAPEAPQTSTLLLELQNTNEGANPSITTLTSQITAALAAAGLTGDVTFTTPVRDDSKCQTGYEVCFTSTLTFNKYYDFTRLQIIPAEQAQTEFPQSSFYAAMAVDGVHTTTSTTTGHTTGGFAVNNKNTIAAGIFIPVMILLAIGVHWFLSSHLERVGDKITSPLRHHLFLMVILDAFALILVLGALGTKDWAHDGQGYSSFGLWKFCVPNQCVEATNVSGGYKGVFNATRAFTIFAFFSSLTALVVCIVLIVREFQKFLLSQVLFIANVLTAIFTFTAMCLFAAFYNDAQLKGDGYHYGGGFGIVAFVWLFSILLTYFLSYIIWKKTMKEVPSAVTPRGSATLPPQQAAETDAGPDDGPGPTTPMHASAPAPTVEVEEQGNEVTEPAATEPVYTEEAQATAEEGTQEV